MLAMEAVNAFPSLFLWNCNSGNVSNPVQRKLQPVCSRACPLSIEITASPTASFLRPLLTADWPADQCISLLVTLLLAFVAFLECYLFL